MSQCVPNWELDDDPAPLPRLPLRHHSSDSSSSLPADAAMLDYEVAELTWENGQLAMHGLGPPRAATKHLPANSLPAKYTWDKPRAGGTLESIVNQATFFPKGKPTACEELVPWFDDRRAAVASATMTMDAMVPCSNGTQEPAASGQVLEGIGTCVVGCSTRVGSCSAAATNATNNTLEKNTEEAVKRARPANAPVGAAPPERSSRDNSVSGSATYSRQMTLDTCERGPCVFTSTSMGSPENTSSGKQGTKTTTTTGDDRDSVCHSRPQRDTGGEEENKKANGKSSVSTKRSRAAAIHNQSERKRRDKINQRMKTLQKLVPNSIKTDRASMLDEVIEYLKQLQAQVQMMSRMNMSSIMMPMSLQQQLQLSMMAPMGVGMGMGMGMGIGMSVMDMNNMNRPNLTGMHPVLHPTAFMPLAPWDGSGDRLSAPAATVIPDPMATFLACQQPMTMDAYTRMAALYQQLHQPPSSTPKE